MRTAKSCYWGKEHSRQRNSGVVGDMAAYTESTLQSKLVRDDESPAMIDMIIRNRTPALFEIYLSDIWGNYWVYNKCMDAGKRFYRKRRGWYRNRLVGKGCLENTGKAVSGT